jgi:hypothetical protein
MEKLITYLQDIKVRQDFVKVNGNSVHLSYLPGSHLKKLIEFCEENDHDFCIVDGLEIIINN